MLGMTALRFTSSTVSPAFAGEARHGQNPQKNVGITARPIIAIWRKPKCEKLRKRIGEANRVQPLFFMP